MLCSNCSASLNMFSKKKCSVCSQMFCQKCVQQRSPKVCSKCCILSSGNFTVKDLELYTSKELRNFLNGKQISLNNCFEKSDLIALIMTTCSNHNRDNDDPEHQRYVQSLKAKFHREVIADVRSPTNLSSRANGKDNSMTKTNNANFKNSFSPTTSPAPLISVDTNNSNANVNEVDPRARNIPPPSYDQISNASQTSFMDTSSLTDIQDSEPTEREQVSTEPKETLADANAASLQQKHQVPPSSSNASKIQSSEKRIKLDDLNGITDIDSLNIRQMKEILTCNFVNYKGCCEKAELSNMVANLWLEHSKNKSLENLDRIPSSDVCKICMENVIDCILLECGHMVACKHCGKQLAECPICRKYVSRVVHIFRA